MTEEEKKAAQAAEFEKSLEGLSDEEKSQKIKAQEDLSKKNTEIENALKIERERREKAEKDLEETRRKAKERIEKKRERELAGNDPDEDDNKPLTKRDLDAMLQERDESLTKQLTEKEAIEVAKRLSGDDQKSAELTLEIWKNRKLVGSVEQQITEAYAIAHAGKLAATINELRRAMASGGSVTTDGSNPQRKSDDTSSPNLSVADKTVLTGHVWDSSANAFKKVIAGGRKIHFVSKDLKTNWVENAPGKK